MPFTIDYLTLRSPGFQAAMRKLCAFSGYGDTKVSYNIARIGDLLQQEVKKADKAFIELAKQYIKNDERGGLIHENGQWVFKDQAAGKEFEKKFGEFHAKEVTVERYKIKLSDAMMAGLSPNDILSLEPVIEDDMEDAVLHTPGKSKPLAKERITRVKRVAKAIEKEAHQ